MNPKTKQRTRWLSFLESPEESSAPLRALASLVAVLLAGCGPASLAEADGHRLPVDHAAKMIFENSSVPVDSQVVQVLAELWVDYTLLASLVEADTSLVTLEVEDVTRPTLEAQMLLRLQEEVVEVDTVVSDRELAERFAADMPGAQATASQILLRFPNGATARQRDSVLATANSLRRRLDEGADFAFIAARFSNDMGSARRGGNLGTFARGQMLPPVDEAVFGLSPGQVSDPVLTDLGYHILRLEAMEIPSLDEVRDRFSQQIKQERLAEAEAEYIVALDSAKALELADEGLTLARALATTAPSRLSQRAARRKLMVWDGGAYTAGELVATMRRSRPEVWQGLSMANDEEVEAFLRQLARQRLLVEEARLRGLGSQEVAVDSVEAEARKAILARARIMGLAKLPVEEEPSVAEDLTSPLDGADKPETPDMFSPGRGSDPPARPRGMEGPEGPSPVAGALRGNYTDTMNVGEMSVSGRVDQLLARILAGEREIVPLGGVTLLLRDQADWTVHARKIEATIGRVRELQSEMMGSGNR